MSAVVRMAMDFRLLGPLEVRQGGAEVIVAGGKPRAVLAALLLSPGRVVPVDELTELLWGSAPPPKSRITLQNHVKRLRNALGEAGRERITTRSPGYLISVDAAELDVTRFEGLLAAARAAARKDAWATAADHAAAALTLWRGNPLADVESEQLVLQQLPRLAELRLQALEIRIDADLGLGRYDEAIIELSDLAGAHPEREHLHARLMLALYRDGRQGEALAAYQRARQVLVDEFGVEPGTELKELQQRILAADPALAAPRETAPGETAPGESAPPAAGDTARITAAGAGTASGRARRDSPYQGLRAFHGRDAGFFFGRETAAAQLLERMARCLDSGGLLIVSGASGVGKSSLVQAGVLPRLRGGGLPGVPAAAAWPRLHLTPGHAPLDELAVRIGRLAGADAAQVRRGLGADPAGFALTARQASLARERPAGQAADPDGTAGGRPRLLLVVDQFEQLFAQCPDEAQRRAFITALHAAATVGQQPGHERAALVVLVVRADFEARCADFPQLAGAVQDRYLVTPMTARQLRMAITRPARAAGSAVDDELVAVLLRELSADQPATDSRPGTASRAGVLPLLSHALDQAWRTRAGDTLTLADYERAGGIEGAVADSAQRAYDLLTAPQRAVARQVFTRLTATGADGTDTADRVPRSDLTEGKTEAQARDVAAVVESFAAERLLTLTADSVEISHEVLLSAWPLLRDSWLADTQADRITRTRLRSAAAEWARCAGDPSYLYHGSLLEAARETAGRIGADPARHPPLSQRERDFLQASDRGRRRSRRRGRLLLALLAGLVVAFAAVAGVALHASQVAGRERGTAVAGQLIAQSESLGDLNPALARLESVAAWRLQPSAQARYAMLNAAALPGIGVIDSGAGPAYSVAVSPDGKILAIGSLSQIGGAEGAVRLWDLPARRQIAIIHVADAGGVTALAFSPDGTTLAVGGYDGTVSLWEVAARREAGTPLVSTPVPGDNVKSVAFSQDGKTLAAGDHNGTVRLWDVATHRQVGAIRTGGGVTVNSVAFSPDGTTVATGSATADLYGTVRLWDIATGKQIGAPLADGAGEEYSVAFSPDGKTLAVGSWGLDLDAYGTLQLWDVAAHHRVATLLTGDEDGVVSVGFSPDGATVAAGGYDGAVRLWDVSTRQQIGAPLSGASGAVTSVAFTPDGATLATGSYDGAARLWNVSLASPDTVGGPPPGPARAVALSPDGRTLAVATTDGTVQLWDVATRRQDDVPLAVGTRDILSMAFSPDGKTLAIVDLEGGPVRLWDVADRHQVGAIAAAAAGQYVVAVAFSPDGKTLATAGASSSVAGLALLWDVATGRRVGRALAGGDSYDAVAFGPHGTTLATASIDGIVRLWDAATGRQLGNPIADGSASAVSVALSPDGVASAVGSTDGTVRLFDVATGQQIGAPLTVGARLFNIAFSPDGETLTTVEPDRTIESWNVTYLVDLPNSLCAAAAPFLTGAEWAQSVQYPPYQDVCP